MNITNLDAHRHFAQAHEHAICVITVTVGKRPDGCEVVAVSYRPSEAGLTDAQVTGWLDAAADLTRGPGLLER
jgi:hypothetical protein